MFIIIKVFSFFFLFWSIIPQVYLQSCLTFPSNSSEILNSAVLPDDGTGIDGFQVFDVDGMTYPYTVGSLSGDESFRCGPSANVINCGPAYQCCFTIIQVEVDPSIENNWIVSTYYPTEAEVIQIQISCEQFNAFPVPDCRSAFYIYYYESDTSVSDISNFLPQFSPATLSINQTFNDRLVYATFNKEKGGFYIGFFNNGTCSIINTFQIYYNICPSLTTTEMSSVPETPVPRLSQQPTQANISCPPGSLSRNIAECYSNSNWVLYPCECVAGWRQLSNLSCAACPVNSYKEFVGNERECVTCPSESSTDGNTGSVTCECGAGFYRGEEESVSMECGRSPSAVRNIRVERYSVERAMLRVLWDEPVEVFNRSVSYNLSLYTRESDRDVLAWSGISVDLWYNLSESELEGSREYVLVVTPLNNLVELSGMENSENISFVSTFPLLKNFSLIENNSIFKFDYELKGGVNELSFELNYTSNGGVMMQAAVNGCSQRSEDTYGCRVTVNNFNQSEDFILTLITFSSVETNAFSDVFNLLLIEISTPSNTMTSLPNPTTNTSQPTTNSSICSNTLLQVLPILLKISTFTSFGMFLIVVLLALIMIALLVCTRRNSNTKQEDIAYSRN